MAKITIGICGSYGGMNLGDEAILQSIIAGIRSSLDADIVVLSRSAEDTERRHGVRAVPFRDMARDEVRSAIGQLDLFILGGGGILYDADATMYLRPLSLAHEAGIPTMVYAVSAGPLEQPEQQELVATALSDATVITVRDKESQQLLEEIGVERTIAKTADPAILIEPEEISDETFEREGLASSRPLVALSVREPGPAAPAIDASEYQQVLANAADFMVERFGSQVVFVPMERKTMDVQYSHAIISRMQHPQEAVVLRGEYSPGAILSIIGRCEFAVGMRLHFLIFAASRRVPFVALPYAAKVRGFLDEMEMSSPSIENISTGHLLAMIDRSWDFRSDIRDHIEARFPRMREQASETNRILLRLIEESGLNRAPEGGR